MTVTNKLHYKTIHILINVLTCDSLLCCTIIINIILTAYSLSVVVASCPNVRVVIT